MNDIVKNNSGRLGKAAIILGTLTWAVCSIAQEKADKPDRAATIEYINGVLAKSKGSSLQSNHVVGALRIEEHELSFDPKTKTYTITLKEFGRGSVDGVAGSFTRGYIRSNWNFKNLDSMKEASATVTTVASEDSAPVEHPSGELKRIALTFKTSSVRNISINRIYTTVSGSRSYDSEPAAINYLSFYYRIADPNDARRLANALLRLKEIEDSEKDPFLN